VDLLITVPDHWLAARDCAGCWEPFGGNTPAIGFLLICFFIPKAK
jgi:hypothetical protein